MSFHSLQENYRRRVKKIFYHYEAEANISSKSRKSRENLHSLTTIVKENSEQISLFRLIFKKRNQHWRHETVKYYV